MHGLAGSRHVFMVSICEIGSFSIFFFIQTVDSITFSCNFWVSWPRWLVARCKDLTFWEQWSGRFLGTISWDPRVCKSNWLHADILRFSFIKLGISSIYSSKLIGNLPAVLDFNWLFLQLNRFICNQLPVLPDHSLGAIQGGRGRESFKALNF